jgi:membrane protease YdiL (CAAX protease family)
MNDSGGADRKPPVDTNDVNGSDKNRPSARIAFALFAASVALLFCARQFITVGDDWLPLWQLTQEIVFFGLPWAIYYQAKPDAKPFTRMTRIPLGRGGTPIQTGERGAARPIRISTCLVTALAALIGLEYFSGMDTLWVALLSRFGLNLDTLGQWLAAENSEGLFTSLLAMAAAPALFEELSFRGLLLPAMERYGSGRAAVITGLLFALAHMSLPGLPTHLLLGVALGMLAIASDSLILPMIYHFAHNAGAIMAGYFTQVDATLALRELLSRDVTLTVFIQTAVSFALWALMIRSVFMSASFGLPKTAQGSPKRERFPRGLAIAITLLTLALLSVYALQFAALKT